MDLSVIGGALREGSDDERLSALQSIDEPVDLRLVDPMLIATERGGERVREQSVWKLTRSTWRESGVLDRDRVERIVAVARREKHPELLRALLGARPLPASGQVLAAAFDLPDWPGLMRDAVVRCAVDGEVEPATAIALLDRPLDDDDRRTVMRIAEAVYDRTADREVQRRILRVFLSPGTAETRSDACWALRRSEKEGPAAATRFRLAPESITAIFGTPRNCLRALQTLVDDPIALKQVGIFEWLATLLRYDVDPAAYSLLQQEPEALHEFIGGLLRIVHDDVWANLRSSVISFLEEATPVEERDRVVASLARLGPEGDLRYWTERVINRFEGREPTLETFEGTWEDGSGRVLRVELREEGPFVTIAGAGGAPLPRPLRGGGAATTEAMAAATDGRRLRVDLGKGHVGPHYDLVPAGAQLFPQLGRGYPGDDEPAAPWAEPLLPWNRVTPRA